MRGLRDGGLPFWSDRFGLGLPLVAESHVAAFYPLNWLFYWAFDVSTAYRFLMWLHYVAVLAGVTYGYARVLSIDRWGSALAAIGFSLCGFRRCIRPRAVYHLMPFLPMPVAGRPLHGGDRPPGLAGGPSLGLGPSDHPGAFPDPDVDGVLGARDRPLAGFPVWPTAMAVARTHCGPELGNCGCSGRSLSDLGTDSGCEVRTGPPISSPDIYSRGRTGPSGHCHPCTWAASQSAAIPTGPE